MENMGVAVRVWPLSKRETKEGGKITVEIYEKVAKIRNIRVDSLPESFGDSREKVMAFSFDYCYWSVNPEDPQYAFQDVLFRKRSRRQTGLSNWLRNDKYVHGMFQ
ncbi:StAR-related lipid transfer protein 9 [Heterocephalus glaber]|uniref:StAR-related lipid transfer protein 9 n=1 Tax=Heterocephalus glaber TaxID=10181 RepID=G5BHT4_HETGA|nr:StAR-related lipid transfer protein 9 [Heterocephalus glaber]